MFNLHILSFWVGGIMVVCEFIGLVVITKRTYANFYIAMYAHTFSALISTALLLTNTSGLILAKEEDSSKIWVNIVLIFISILCKINTFWLIFVFKRRLNNLYLKYFFMI